MLDSKLLRTELHETAAKLARRKRLKSKLVLLVAILKRKKLNLMQ